MTGRDVGAWLVVPVVVMVVVLAVLLRVLFLELDHTDGTVPAPHVVVWPPSTYGPPAR